jgi:hypothetical protein
MHNKYHNRHSFKDQLMLKVADFSDLSDDVDSILDVEFDLYKIESYC